MGKSQRLKKLRKAVYRNFNRHTPGYDNVIRKVDQEFTDGKTGEKHTLKVDKSQKVCNGLRSVYKKYKKKIVKGEL